MDSHSLFSYLRETCEEAKRRRAVPVMSTVEYVTEDDTLAEVAIKVQTSASLRTSSSILLAALLSASYILNAVLATTVLFCPKLRGRLLYLFFTHLAFVNILSLTFTVLFSLIFVANGEWTMGTGVCRVTAMIQQFTQIYTLFSLILTAVERTITIASSPKVPLFTPIRCVIFHGTLVLVALALSLPILTPAIPVNQFNYRYLCGIGSGSPIAFTATTAILFIGCLLIFLFCSAVILARKTKRRNLPVQPSDYSAFIVMTRQIQEEVSHGKLVLLLITCYILLCGPYAFLCYYYQIRNSAELLASLVPMEIPPDADTLITWIYFLFPLFVPIIIFCWCNDIWPNIKEIFCCKSSELPTLSYYQNPKGQFASTNVMTLVATADGLQLKMAPAPSDPAYKVPIIAPSISDIVQSPVITDFPRPANNQPTYQPRRVQREPDRMLFHPPGYIPYDDEEDDVHRPSKQSIRSDNSSKTTSTAKRTSTTTSTSSSSPSLAPRTTRKTRPTRREESNEPPVRRSLMKPPTKRRTTRPVANKTMRP